MVGIDCADCFGIFFFEMKSLLAFIDLASAVTAGPHGCSSIGIAVFAVWTTGRIFVEAFAILDTLVVITLVFDAIAIDALLLNAADPVAVAAVVGI